MEQSKEIKVYGTLMNHTIDPDKQGVDKYGEPHYDAIAYAWQLYDNHFGEPVSVDNYQDVINKRLTAISYIEDEPGKDPYTVIDSDLEINGDVRGIELWELDDVADTAKNPQDGAILIYDATIGQWKPSDITLNSIINRIEQLEASSSLWEIVPGDNTKIQAKDNRSAVANMFFDSNPQ